MFGLLLGEKNVANIRVVQIAVAFLKMASNSLHTVGKSFKLFAHPSY